MVRIVVLSLVFVLAEAGAVLAQDFSLEQRSTTFAYVEQAFEFGAHEEVGAIFGDFYVVKAMLRYKALTAGE